MLHWVSALALVTVYLSIAINPCFARVERPRPKLVLAIIVDQFRYDYLRRFDDTYTGGFATLLDHGAVFADAHYPHYPTVTAVGHSTFLSGATPSVSGIIGNDWFERTPFITKEECPETEGTTSGAVASVADASTCLVGPIARKRGSSPRRLLVSTLGDELKMARTGQRPQSKVFGLSLKDRGAILTSGHMSDGAYWFDSNLVVSSTYYMPTLPPWIVEFNAGLPKRIAQYKWFPLQPPNDKAFCALSVEVGVRKCGYPLDNNNPNDKPKLESSPLANDLVEELAEQIIEREGLGSRDATDILTISFSANDYVGHELGPDSPEVRDISIRTDRLLKKLLDFLERAGLGRGKTLVVLSADHGVAATPKANNDRRMPGGYIYSSDIEANLNKRLGQHFGKTGTRWISSLRDGFLYLNHDEINKLKLDITDVRRVAAEEVGKTPNVARVYTRDELSRGVAGADRVARAVQLGFNSRRSGDVVLLPEPNFMFAPRPGTFDSGTSHFTPYTYDTHVPVIFYAPGIIRSGFNYGRIDVNDVAPTLAAILGVEAPSGSSGRILSEIFE